MKKIPTFALPNEVFIWVPIKILVNCDLNLLLIEYYKEVLKSWLKKEKTRIHAHIIFAKLTDNSRLNLPTDCNKLFDLRSIFYTLFTPLFSSILVPLFILNSFSISCICLISLSFFTSQLFSDVKTFDCAKNITNMADTIVEPSINNTKKSTTISSNFNTSKDSMPVSISLYFHAIMPYLGTPETSFFEDSNVTNFFEWYSQMCTNYYIDK